MYNFLFMLHNCITIHGKTNIKIRILSMIFIILIILMTRVFYTINKKTLCRPFDGAERTLISSIRILEKNFITQKQIWLLEHQDKSSFLSFSFLRTDSSKRSICSIIKDRLTVWLIQVTSTTVFSHAAERCIAGQQSQGCRINSIDIWHVTSHTVVFSRSPKHESKKSLKSNPVIQYEFNSKCSRFREFDKLYCKLQYEVPI